jgi:hypothetical protein
VKQAYQEQRKQGGSHMQSRGPDRDDHDRRDKRDD